jgi:hypothetical protein
VIRPLHWRTNDGPTWRKEKKGARSIFTGVVFHPQIGMHLHYLLRRAPIIGLTGDIIKRALVIQYNYWLTVNATERGVGSE